ncbi:hypothetical protein KZ813_00785 [Sphingomonas sp. RHCKR7]|uniref:hypothetical protein n=1 Tax=Sphingomonas folli TaxID=2862497 RepID=UPI001CA523A1|nr:hypothetical protein [Sphingomonas folli]MBW6525368.1 hypothetical protein [Sphingomonas folli]
MARATHEPEVTRLLARRTVEMAAVFMIGDGMLGLLQPRRHVALWQERALGAEALVAPFVGRPGRRRAYALLQIAAGIALAARQHAR